MLRYVVESSDTNPKKINLDLNNNITNDRNIKNTIGHESTINNDKNNHERYELCNKEEECAPDKSIIDSNSNNTSSKLYSPNNNFDDSVTTSGSPSDNKSHKYLHSSIYNKKTKYDWKDILSNNSNTNKCEYNSQYNKNNNDEVINNNNKTIVNHHTLNPINTNSNNVHLSIPSHNKSNNNKLFNYKKNSCNSYNEIIIPAFLKSRSRHRPKLTQSRQAIKLMHQRSPSMDATEKHSEEFNDSETLANNGTYNDVFSGGYRWSLRSSISSFGGRLGGLSASTATSCSSICNDLEVFSDQMMEFCYDDDELIKLEKENFENNKFSDNSEPPYDDIEKDEIEVKNNSKKLKPLINHSSLSKISDEDGIVDDNNNDIKVINRNYISETNKSKIDKDQHQRNYISKHEDNKNINMNDLNTQINKLKNNKIKYKPENYLNIRTITLTKRKEKKKLGFTVVGGWKGVQDWVDVHVKTILPDGLAAENEILRKGDRIISINDILLTNSSHHDVVQIIKKVSRECRTVKLVVTDGQALQPPTKKNKDLHELNNAKLKEREEHDKVTINSKNSNRDTSLCYNTQNSSVQDVGLADISLFTQKFQLLTCDLRQNDINTRNSLESSDEQDINSSQHSSFNDFSNNSANDHFYVLEERKRDYKKALTCDAHEISHEERLCSLSNKLRNDNFIQLTTPLQLESSLQQISSPIHTMKSLSLTKSPQNSLRKEIKYNSEKKSLQSPCEKKCFDSVTGWNFMHLEEMKQDGWIIEEC